MSYSVGKYTFLDAFVCFFFVFSVPLFSSGLEASLSLPVWEAMKDNQVTYHVYFLKLQGSLISHPFPFYMC